MKFTILIIDDEKNIREGLGAAFEMEGYEVRLAANGKEGLDCIAKGDIDLVITDLRMDGISGEEVLRRVTTETPGIPVIVLTGHGSIDAAVDAMRNGAYDFLTKPLNLDRLSMHVKRALERRELSLQHTQLKAEVSSAHTLDNMIGKSGEMQKVFTLIKKVAPTKASVLITGESGVGKELVADAIHNLSPRSAHEMIKVHCAALSETLLESELFGHEKGAYTGAEKMQKGRFELAHESTIFLDEIGELGLDEQAMLLKALEEKHYYPVGSDTEITSNFQLISGTNRDLRDDVRAGRFREDLYARINIWNYPLPALADRREDIEPNIAHQLALASQELGRTTRFNKEARAAYLNFALSPEAPWRGNFRDLAASIMRLATLAPQGRITTELVQAEIARLRWLWQDTSAPAASVIPAKANPDGLDLFDRLQLENVITVCRQHKTLAAAGRALYHISREQRATANDSDRLRKYLHKFGLTWADITAPS